MEQFQKVIKSYLDNLAQQDALFAASYAKENKSIKECCDFIVQQAKKVADNKQGACLPREEVFNLAVHYYHEDNLGEIKEIRARIVTPYVVELTEAEKAELKKKAEDEYVKGLLHDLRKPKKKEQTAATTDVEQLDLFA